MVSIFLFCFVLFRVHCTAYMKLVAFHLRCPMFARGHIGIIKTLTHAVVASCLFVLFAKKYKRLFNIILHIPRLLLYLTVLLCWPWIKSLFCGLFSLLTVFFREHGQSKQTNRKDALYQIFSSLLISICSCLAGWHRKQHIQHNAKYKSILCHSKIH